MDTRGPGGYKEALVFCDLDPGERRRVGALLPEPVDLKLLPGGGCDFQEDLAGMAHDFPRHVDDPPA